MTVPRDKLKRWGLIVGIVLGVSTIITLWLGWCSQTGMATPLNAASKEDVEIVDSRVDKLEKKLDRIEGKVDLLLLDRKLRYTPQKEE